MIAFSGCYYGGEDKEKSGLGKSVSYGKHCLK
jgi:hypothetical protein